MPKETYLGDGLYASMEGDMLKLRAPRIDGDHEVFLEPEICAELVRFIGRGFIDRCLGLAND